MNLISDAINAPRQHVAIYTDGACSGNPGPGGYGVVLLAAGKRKELAGGYRLTTNNRMEIMAVIAGLQALKTPCIVTLYSDSRYVCDSINKGWAKSWRRNGWRKSNGDAALNSDLWEEVLRLLDKHSVTIEWVKGHAGNPENERCDALSTAFANRANLPADTGYEAPEIPK